MELLQVGNLKKLGEYKLALCEIVFNFYTLFNSLLPDKDGIKYVITSGKYVNLGFSFGE